MMVFNILTNKCPNCRKGKVFHNSNLFTFLPGKMNNECPVCKLDFSKEPGFYWGAMYVSYALGVAEAFITYFICRLAGTEAFDLLNLWIIFGAILVLAPFNYRLSRLVWLYIFT
jgi:uncharacterized protein (DUF983 family)